MYTNRDNRPSGGRSFARREYGNSSGPRQMFKAVCSGCGKDCEVPFMPSGSKPVYCSDCFSKQSDNTFKPRFENRVSSTPQPQNNEQLKTIIVKLDKIITLLSSCSNDTCCQDEAGCQKESIEVAKPKIVKEETKVAIEEKVKTPKKSVKAPKK